MFVITQNYNYDQMTMWITIIVAVSAQVLVVTPLSTEWGEMTAETDVEDPVLKAFLNEHRRPKNLAAPLFREPVESGGIPKEFIIMMFQNDRGSRFRNRFKDKIKHHFDISENQASLFLVECDDKTVEDIRKIPEVAFVKQNAVHKFDGCDKMENLQPDGKSFISWGLGRIQKRCGISKVYKYNDDNDEDEVAVYVLDTGVSRERKDEFCGGLLEGIDVSDAGDSLGDIVGHGTFVAGIIASKTFGVAKTAKIISVRLSNKGELNEFRVLEGLKFVKENVKKTKQKKAIANLSLSGPKSCMVNKLANSLVNDGIAVFSAAGNSADDSCKFSPVSDDGVIGVGCTTINDTFCIRTNWGECVDVLAPGRNIPSLRNIRGSDPSIRSGTSASTPFAVGAAALLLSRKDLSPYKLKKKLITMATKGAIKEIPRTDVTTNLLLYSKCKN